MDKSNSVKKGHQENKKKKNQENRAKIPDKSVNNINRPKKAKKNKSNEGEKPLKKTTKQGSSCLWFVFISMLVAAVAIGFLYLVDYEKFMRVKHTANDSLNKTLSHLPPEVVTMGRNAFEFIRPSAEVVISKLGIFLSALSTFLNTNPIVKDHWVNAREISSICGGLFADYLRTLYLQTSRLCSRLWP